MALVVMTGTFMIVPRVVAGTTCDDNAGNSPWVCVSHPDLNPPTSQHFTFSFADTSNPDVVLKVGGDWTVSSQVDDEDDTPANIGDISIDPAVDSDEDFSLTLLNGTGAGAANVATIDLDDSDWTGHSSITDGHISGNLSGDVTLVKPGRAGARTCQNY